MKDASQFRIFGIGTTFTIGLPVDAGGGSP